MFIEDGMKKENQQKNIFERHPKTTMMFTVGGLIVILVLGFEHYLVRYYSHKEKVGLRRFIRLREHYPSGINYVSLDEKAGGYTDYFDPKKYRFQIDEEGFVYPSIIHENPDLTIVFLGGSTTECMYVDEKKRFSYLVGRMIEAENRLRVNSVNSGVSGNNTLHSINILLNKIIPMNPDYVILMHNTNDLSVLLYEKTYWNSNRSRSVIIPENPNTLRTVAKALKNWLIPMTYMKVKKALIRCGIWERRDEFAHIRGKAIRIEATRLTNEFRSNLQIFIDICRARHIQPVLMTLFNWYEPEPHPLVKELLSDMENDFGITYESYYDIFTKFNQTIRDTGQRHGVTVIDLDRLLPKNLELTYDLGHLNNDGSALVAQIVTEQLLTIIKK